MANRRTRKSAQKSAAKNKGSSTAGKRQGQSQAAARSAPPKSPAKTTSSSSTKSSRAAQLSKAVPVGRTIKTKDKYLPIQKGSKPQNPKDKRWIAVIARNEKGELAVVRLTTEEQANTTKLKNYKHGNGKTTYFKHFVEIQDNEGNPIKIDGVRFVENPKEYDLTNSQVMQVSEKVLKHTKQASENNKKIAALLSGGKIDKKKR